MYTIKTYPEDQVILRRFTGEITFSVISESWKALLQHKEFTENRFSLLSDYSRAELKIQPHSIEEVKDFYKRNGLFLHSKHAIVINGPFQAAFSLMLQKEQDNYKTFTNFQQAYQWLSI